MGGYLRAHHTGAQDGDVLDSYHGNQTSAAGLLRGVGKDAAAG